MKVEFNFESVYNKAIKQLKNDIFLNKRKFHVLIGSTSMPLLKTKWTNERYQLDTVAMVKCRNGPRPY
ncbi:hypothetical protein DWY55_20500 [Bacteroides sp. AF25-38AC]|nr:hypothetical protein DWY55_20500 [Bacteroides sp. AF25-38AC]